jgi:hypothetical protein
VGEDVDDLLTHRGGVDADDRGAERLGCQFADQPLGAVVAEDRDHLACPHPEVREPVGEVSDPLVVRRPRNGLPDAVPFLLQRRAAVPVRLGESTEQLGEGHVFGDRIRRGFAWADDRSAVGGAGCGVVGRRAVGVVGQAHATSSPR